MRAPRPASAASSARSASRDLHYATSPLLAEKTPPWRSRFVVAMVGLAFAVLVGRALYVQVIGTDFYQREGDKRFKHAIELPASRGRILDRNGLMLATSIDAPSIWVIPKDFKADAAQRAQLQQLLNLKPEELDEKLQPTRKFVRLRRHVEAPIAQQVAQLKIAGLHQLPDERRRYPEGAAVAQLVGFTNTEGEGAEGLERHFDEWLTGQEGQRIVVKDRLGHVVEDARERVAPVHGKDLTLSIDSKVQFYAYQRLRDAVQEQGAQAGSAVVLDAKSGEVLALVNYPSFEPGDRLVDADARLRNRALTDTFEPGSTMKPLTVSLALELGRVTPETPIQTAPGRIQIGNRTISDVHAYGVLSVAQVVQKSSNVGTVRISQRLQPAEMHAFFAKVGLGRKPEIEFPGATRGRLHPYAKWGQIGQATMSYGYGLNASLFQLAHAYTIFARDGELIPLTLVKREQPEGGEPALVRGERVLSEQTARTMRGFLQTAAAPGGTAPKAMTMGYSVGGKSGTARKNVEGRGYVNRYRSWFVGLSPVSDPRIVVAVMIDEPSKGVIYGGDVAAPVFSQVVQQTLRMLGVAPDLEVKAQVTSKPVAAEPESF